MVVGLEEKIDKVIKGISEVLIEKNKRYGNSALAPINVFFKGNSTNSIRVRLDDKISRVRNSDTLRKNDMFDILGYLTLFSLSSERYDEQGIVFIEQVDKVMKLVKKYIQLRMEAKSTFVKDDMKTEHLLVEMDYILRYEITGSFDATESIAVLRLIANIILYFALTDVTDFKEMLD